MPKRRKGGVNSSPAGVSTGNGAAEKTQEFKRLKDNRFKPSYVYAQKNALKSFFKWFSKHHKKYNKPHKLFHKDRRSGEWIMTEVEARRWVKHVGDNAGQGNCLFDYVIDKRRDFHAQMIQGMCHFRDVRAALFKRIKSLKVFYDERAEVNLGEFWRALASENSEWCQKNGIDDQARAAVPFSVYEAIALAMLEEDEIVSWCYLVLQWNMMARLGNVDDIHFNFIRWSEI